MALRQEEFTSLCDDVDLDRDRALVERCQSGDSAAFGNLYARYYERLLRFCLRRLNDRHEAEDAAQEAFARAWKALPNFAGERRFYPWLTVIAGNICTDMLRRRSRSTPTDDLEMSAHQPLGSGGNETSEELVLAAVDGELVNRALGRLSVRHRHVLAMREGSGWTYQQIADHEGVEIGTIETLLWRARQALKREFTVLSESKGALAGFLGGAGALARRGLLRVVGRSADLQAAGGAGSLRNAFAGVAVTSAAVAAAIITPNAFSTSKPPVQSAISTPAGQASFAGPELPPIVSPSSAAPSLASIPALGDNDGSGGSGSDGVVGAILPAPALASGPVSTVRHQPQHVSPAGGSSDSGGGGGGNTNAPNLTAPLASLAPVVSGLGSVTSDLTNTVSGLANTLGLGAVLTQLGLVPASTDGSTAAGTDNSSSTSTSPTTTLTTIPDVIDSVTNTVSSTLKSLLGHK